MLLPVLDDDKHYWVGGRRGRQAAAPGRPVARGAPGPRADRPALPAPRPAPDQGRAGRAVRGRGRRPRPKRPGERRPRGVGRAPGGRPERPAGVAARPAPGGRARRDQGQRRPQRAGPRLRLRQAARRAGASSPGCERIVGVDVSHRALEAAGRRLHLDRMAPRQRERVDLLHGSLTYRDSRLRGFDAAAVVEVIEHLDPPRLGAFERALFGHARPGTVVLTTPNAEYNVLLTGLAAGSFRHADHRFEWTAGSSPSGRRGSRPVTAIRQSSPASGPRAPAGRCRARLPVPAGGVPAMTVHQDPRPLAGGPGRRHRLRQVDLRRAALPAHRGDLVGLLPRAGQRRPERSVRHRRRLRRAALHRGQTAGGGPADRDRCHQRPAGRAPAAHRTGPPASRAGRRDRPRRPRRDLRGAQLGPPGPRVRAPRATPAAGPAAPQPRAGCAGRDSTGSSCCAARPRSTAAVVEREPLWNDRRTEHGPFDIIGDVHGCFAELTALLGRLGYAVDADGASARHPAGRKAVFVGDLVDRGPATPAVLRLVMGMTAEGSGLSVAGNHEVKLVRALRGRKVIRHARPGARAWRSSRPSRPGSAEQVDRVHRRAARPRGPRRRQAGGRARRAARGHARPGVGGGPGLRPVRRHHRRDR